MPELTNPKFVHKLAVRIYKAASIPVRDILAHKKLEELRLPRSALSDHVQMAAAIDALDAENELLFLECGDIVGAADIRDILRR